MPVLKRVARSLAPSSRSKSLDLELRLDGSLVGAAGFREGILDSRLISDLQRRLMFSRLALGCFQRLGEVNRHDRQVGVFGILDYDLLFPGRPAGLTLSPKNRLLVSNEGGVSAVIVGHRLWKVQLFRIVYFALS